MPFVRDWAAPLLTETQAERAVRIWGDQFTQVLSVATVGRDAWTRRLLARVAQDRGGDGAHAKDDEMHLLELSRSDVELWDALESWMNRPAASARLRVLN